MYDLIIRDATIVSSAGRQVADVAIKEGSIAYVGPRPPRSARRELSAIGKFLMPGMIDTAAHVGLDGSSWSRESGAAVTGGVTTVFALPAGAACGEVAQRAAMLAAHSWCDFGLWGLATAENRDELRALVEEGTLLAVLAILGDAPEAIDTAILERSMDLPGTLGVQVLADSADPSNASPEAREVVRVAREHDRAVHWVNLSTTAELELLDPVRGGMPVTAGVTPHHLLLPVEDYGFVEVRPPLRGEQDRRTLWTALRRGRIDCLATDHRPARRGEPGLPSLEVVLPLMMAAVRQGRFSLEQLVGICSEGPARVFGLPRKGRIAKGADADLVLFTEGEMERIEEEALSSGAGWSPYAGREAAPKPDLVMVGGEVVAVRGEIVGEKPRGKRV